MIRHDIRRSVWCGDPLSLVPGSRGDPSWTVSTAVMFSAVPPVQSACSKPHSDGGAQNTLSDSSVELDQQLLWEVTKGHPLLL